MKWRWFLGLVGVVAVIGLLVWLYWGRSVQVLNNHERSLSVVVEGLTEEGRLPVFYTCDGEAVSPPLSLKNVPAGAASLVLMVNDLDAPSGQYIHWLVWNINPQTKVWLEDTLPLGATTGTGSAGRVGYVPPCPPNDSDHRYAFTILALNTVLDLPVSTTIKELKTAIDGHILGQAEMVVKYSR